ncbi:MAG: hypothetical protein H7315_13825 [Herminiimonas sp.]|nr:hypothetical protein [Herminiimonas sp.]
MSLRAITGLDTGTWETKVIDPGVVPKKRDPVAQYREDGLPNQFVKGSVSASDKVDAGPAAPHECR